MLKIIITKIKFKTTLLQMPINSPKISYVNIIYWEIQNVFEVKYFQAL